MRPFLFSYSMELCNVSYADWMSPPFRRLGAGESSALNGSLSFCEIPQCQSFHNISFASMPTARYNATLCINTF